MSGRARLSYIALACAAGLAVGIGVAALPAGSSPDPARAAVSAGQPSPLDPLSAAEISTTFQVIEKSKGFPKGAFFPLVTLKEPSKTEVDSWTPGEPFSRQAFANVYDRTADRLFEAVVDLRSKTLVSFTEKPGVEPAVFGSEYGDADAIVRADPRWQKAMRDRGLKPKDVYLDVWAPGDVPFPTDPPNTRLLRALSFYRGSLPNPYDRPIEGVTVTIDMNHMKVVDVTDTGARPVNTTNPGSAAQPRPPLARLVTSQPDGPGFQIDGTLVTWQGWTFRVGFSQREGVILHRIAFQHRRVIHRISLDEIYVPYGLPDRNWVWRAALDVGEYNLGQLAEPLAPKVDVPPQAVFLDEAVPNDQGSAGDPPAYVLPHAVAIYERDAGPLWDRTDPTTFERDARFARELVVTSSYVNGNYTYTTDYVFRMDGGIDIVEGATGTTLNRGVSSTAEGDQHGTNVTDNVAAPDHQHFFNFRIDFDVDGTNNRVVEENTHPEPSSFGNAYSTQRTVLTTEQARDQNPQTDRRWVVENAAKQNALGAPTAYELAPMGFMQPMSDPGYEPLQHAGFAQHALWVTKYRGSELQAAGDYPNQGPAGQGVPAYAADQAPIDGADVVLWYTVGLPHDPTVEEYPVMTRETVGFSLRPDGFLNQNPALDAP